MSEPPGNNLLNSDGTSSGSRANGVQQRQNWMQTFPFKAENALWKKGEALTVQEHAIHVELP